MPATPTHRADLVAVLGGDKGQRYAVGRQLVLDGYSNRLLLIHPGAAVRNDVLLHLRSADV